LHDRQLSDDPLAEGLVLPQVLGSDITDQRSRLIDEAVEAVDPNPATNDEEVTHPHVKSNGLCAGDATVPIQAALQDGRICDAMLLVNAVLQHYNPASPYVSLSRRSSAIRPLPI
jgi:hypothetical protein